MEKIKVISDGTSIGTKIMYGDKIIGGVWKMELKAEAGIEGIEAILYFKNVSVDMDINLDKVKFIELKI